MHRIHFEFADTEEDEFRTIVNAKRYKKALLDLKKWIDSEMHKDQQMLDLDTLDEIDRRIRQVLVDYNLDI